MAATATLVPAPPLSQQKRVGRLENTVTVIDSADPHVALGTFYERDLQINGTAVWDGNACETGGSSKTATEVNGEVTGIPYTVFQMAKCRMLNEWDTLGTRMGTLFEAGEWRTIEEAFATALAAGDYGTVGAGTAGVNDSPLAVVAAAEKYLAENLAFGYIVMSPEVATYAISKDVVIRNGDSLETHLGTPVLLLPTGLTVYVMGNIVIWRGARSEPHPAQTLTTSNYDNEFVVLTERVYTIAVEGGETDGSLEILSWTVDPLDA